MTFGRSGQRPTSQVKRQGGAAFISAALLPTIIFFFGIGATPDSEFYFIFIGFKSMIYSPNNPESTPKVIIVELPEKGGQQAGAKTESTCDPWLRRNLVSVTVHGTS
jgi:hypothetical protein